MKRHSSNAKALKHPHDVVAKPEREWNILREKCLTPARVFAGTGLNEGNRLAGISFAIELLTITTIAPCMDVCKATGK